MKAKTSGRASVLVALLFLLAAQPAAGEGGEDLAPAAKEKCGVCGMFVAKHPEWIAAIIFKDGSREFFDGAKDMFKYYFSMAEYTGEHTRKDVMELFVTDYYTVTLLPAREAFFVLGSRVYGPMGKEPVPFKSKEEAEEFMKDHGGERALSFKEITNGNIPP